MARGTRLQAGAWFLAFALLGGGCSVSYQLDQGDALRAAEPKATAEMPAEPISPSPVPP